VPFRRQRHHADPVLLAEQRIAVPLERLEERLVEASSNLDDLVTSLGDVAAKVRRVAEQVSQQSGGRGE
jgi:hypothetical protein